MVVGRPKPLYSVFVRSVSVRQVGYFAGAEEPFARLFAEFQQRNEQLRENIERRNQ